ncbi:branched-chain amino acid ABC transporter permease [Candidatus Woesearchaeota archaeon]|nr:branched-chain amino acid ABC transporter permease [Candidatus Woesearchaeota archaeon]
MIESYIIPLLIIISILLILALSLQLTLGYTGLVNLGHVGLMAIGAYASALLSLHGAPLWASTIIASFSSALVGYALMFPIHKLKGDYVALTTMGFSVIVYVILLNWRGLTRGPLGLVGIPRPFESDVAFLLFTCTMALFSFIVIRRIARSSFGTVLRAIRDDETAVRTAGKNTLKVKSCAFAVSGFFAGLAGGIYGQYFAYIDPSSFTFNLSIVFTAIAIIGGLASLKGTVYAAIVLVLLPEPLRFIGFSSSILGPAREMIYGVVVLLVLIYWPKGFLGEVKLG